jgi:hypothetical protein
LLPFGCEPLEGESKAHKNYGNWKHAELPCRSSLRFVTWVTAFRARLGYQGGDHGGIRPSTHFTGIEGGKFMSTQMMQATQTLQKEVKAEKRISLTKIMVLTDFSEVSDLALQYALALARRYQRHQGGSPIQKY